MTLTENTSYVCELISSNLEKQTELTPSSTTVMNYFHL